MSAAESNAARTGVKVRDLTIGYEDDGGRVEIVCGISFDVPAGRTLALVGESGTGKSLTARSLLGLLPRPVGILGGSVTIDGLEIVGATDEQLRRARGKSISLVPQDPMSALNPVRRIRSLFVELLERHTALRGQALLRKVTDVLGEVGLQPGVLDRFPHELSGGMKQRVLIALALVTDPAVVIADEPTTALDATVQAAILDLLARHVAGRAALVLITHDLGVAATVCERIAVMYSGRIVEEGPMRELLAAPQHPYTRGLLAAAPDFDSSTESLVPIPGAPPRPDARPAGCAFSPRCALRDTACDALPTLTGDVHRVACWRREFRTT
jgi:oligopeptide/dipeptide ABC transporter ATP-binding protein